MTKKLKNKGYIDKSWNPEKKKHCWFIKGEAELRGTTKPSFARGVKPSFTHITNNINTINKGAFAHATSNPKTQKERSPQGAVALKDLLSDLKFSKNNLEEVAQ